MKERPLLFSTLMVQALLAGRKTITRRVVKNPLDVDFLNTMEHASRKDVLPDLLNRIATDVNPLTQELQFPCPHGIIGDQIWVRETSINKAVLLYKADFPINSIWFAKQTPAIHLKKENARIWLEISNIRIERLTDISEEDAIAEGCIEHKIIDNSKHDSIAGTLKDGQAQKCFFSLWDKINGRDSHEQNPWVWVIEFKVLSTTGKPVAADQEAATP